MQRNAVYLTERLRASGIDRQVLGAAWRRSSLIHTGSGDPEPRLQAATDARRFDGSPQKPQIAAKGPEDCAESQCARPWAQKGAQGPWRRARRVAGSGTREAGPPRRPRLAAGHISMHRHDMWWSALNATEPDRARPWPTEIRPHKPCIPTSENRTSGHSGEKRWCLHLLGGAAFAVSVGVSVGVALRLDPTGLERCVRFPLEVAVIRRGAGLDSRLSPPPSSRAPRSSPLRRRSAPSAQTRSAT